MEMELEDFFNLWIEGNLQMYKTTQNGVWAWQAWLAWREAGRLSNVSHPERLSSIPLPPELADYLDVCAREAAKTENASKDLLAGMKLYTNDGGPRPGVRALLDRNAVMKVGKCYLHIQNGLSRTEAYERVAKDFSTTPAAIKTHVLKWEKKLGKSSDFKSIKSHVLASL